MTVAMMRPRSWPGPRPISARRSEHSISWPSISHPTLAPLGNLGRGKESTTVCVSPRSPVHTAGEDMRWQLGGSASLEGIVWRPRGRDLPLAPAFGP